MLIWSIAFPTVRPGLRRFTGQMGYSQLTVVSCLVNGFTPHVLWRFGAGYGLGSGLNCGTPARCV